MAKLAKRRYVYHLEEITNWINIGDLDLTKLQDVKEC